MNGTRFFGVCAIVSASTVSGANAGSIPRYDVESYCTEVMNVSGGSKTIFNGCIDMEQSAYNNLKRSWSSLPSQTRSYCDEVGRVAGGSYAIMEGCIQMENQASDNTSVFQY